ncbi:MAG TPA: ankyrin repeat domain-containing protein [Candidatus Babeliales bacterium]|nr:ankyrin repeat domain-containing protein [Candidatus Babeliales bacterium]
MSFFKVRAVYNLKKEKNQLFWWLLITSSCSFNAVQAQVVGANTALIQDIQNNKLTQAGADINNGNVNIFDTNHKAPLTYAVQSTTGNAFTFVTDLLNSDNPSSSIADPTIVDITPGSEQKTILMSALESANEGILLNALGGASSPVYTTIIQTLLTQLKSDGISLLIDVNAKDLNGKTALDYAAAAKNFYAPRALMTLLLTPGIKPPASFTLTPIQKNTQQLWADLIEPSANLVLAPNTVNPNFNLTKVLADITAGIDPNAQDNTGTTALMYVAQALAATTTPTQATELTSLLTALLALPNIDLNLSNLGQPVGLNSNNSNFTSMVTAPATTFEYPTGQIAGGSAGFLSTNTTLNNATSNQITAITNLFNNLNTGTPPQAVLTSANVNYRDPLSNHWTPLLYAVTSSSSANITAVLAYDNVEVNAQEDADNMTALMYAAQATSNALTSIQALLQNPLTNSNIRDDNGMTALMYAIQNGQDPNVINALLAAPSLDLNTTDNNNRTALSLAYTSLKPQSAVITAITNSMNTQLITAIHNGDLATVKKTISTIDNCDSCQCPSCPTLTTIDMVDSNGLTPLMHAAKSLNSNINPVTKVPVAYEIVQTLIDLGGASPIAIDNTGMTPLMYVAQSQNKFFDQTVSPATPVVLEIINALINANANNATLDHNGHTALYYATNNLNNSTVFQTVPYKTQIITALTPLATVSLGMGETKTLLKKSNTRLKTIRRIKQATVKLPNRPIQKT